MDVTSNIMLNDADLLRIERGPYAWAKLKQGRHLDIDQFTVDLKEQFNEIGLQVEVKCFDTNQAGAYGFEVEINGRVGGSIFDPDQMVYEAVNNVLALPGQEGWINTGDALKEWNRDKRNKGKHKH